VAAAAMAARGYGVPVPDVLFGGPHSSEPSFRRATVQTGDLLYPIGVCDQVLYVLGRMRVREIVPVGADRALLEEYFARYGGWRFLAPTCMRPGTTSRSSPGASAWPPCAGTACSSPRQTARPSGGYRCRWSSTRPAGTT